MVTNASSYLPGCAQNFTTAIHPLYHLGGECKDQLHDGEVVRASKGEAAAFVRLSTTSKVKKFKDHQIFSIPPDEEPTKEFHTGDFVEVSVDALGYAWTPAKVTGTSEQNPNKVMVEYVHMNEQEQKTINTNKKYSIRKAVMPGPHCYDGRKRPRTGAVFNPRNNTWH